MNFKKNKPDDTDRIIKAKKKNFKSMDIRELGNTFLDAEEYENVKNFAKQECKQTMVLIIFLMIFMLVFVAQLVRFSSIATDFITIFALVFLTYIEYKLVQKIKGLYRCTIKQSKYGEVIKKYSIATVNENGNDKDYYLDVIFEDSGTFIRRVNISREIYKKINHKDRVLVVSFDDKMVYGIIPKKREKHA